MDVAGLADKDGETPAIVWTGRTLVAFAGASPHIVVSRSTSLGATWSAPKALVTDASNPAPVWDERSKTIIFMYSHDFKYKVVESRDGKRVMLSRFVRCHLANPGKHSLFQRE